MKKDKAPMADPFESLARPLVPLQPRAIFAAELRTRLANQISQIEGEQAMTTTLSTRPLLPAMAYIRTPDPGRSMRFFAGLFLWEAVGEHYVYNVERGPAVRTGHRGRPMPVLSQGTPDNDGLQFAVSDLDAALGNVHAAGGRVFDPANDYASVDDGTGISFVVWQSPGPDAYPTPPPRETATGIPSFFQLETPDPVRTAEFCRAVLGWQLDNGTLIDADQVVAIITRASAARIRAYLAVDDVVEVSTRVRELGGTTGQAYTLTGRQAVDCIDEAGAIFRIIESN